MKPRLKNICRNPNPYEPQDICFRSENKIQDLQKSSVVPSQDNTLPFDEGTQPFSSWPQIADPRV